MTEVNFVFGGRVLRHQKIDWTKVACRAIIRVRPEYRNNPAAAAERLFRVDNRDLFGHALMVYLRHVRPDEDSRYAVLDAQALTNEILHSSKLNGIFLGRQGSRLNEQNVRSAIIGRLGQPEDFLMTRIGAPVAAQALAALLQHDIPGFNRIRQSVIADFDFSGMLALQEVSLKGARHHYIKWRGTYGFSPVVAARQCEFIRIDSGFCAGTMIGPRVKAPDRVYSAFETLFMGRFLNAWLALNQPSSDLTDPADRIAVYPSRIKIRFFPDQNQVFSAENFKYEELFIRNLPAIKRAVAKALAHGNLPISLGGDHSIALATQGTINDYYVQNTGKPIGLVWVDAHGDINNESTTGSGNFHGAPVAGLLGQLGNEQLAGFFKHNINPKNLVYIAARDLDPGEVEIIKQHNIRWFTMEEIRERGIAAVAKEAHDIASNGTAGVSVSFDIDAFDAALVPGTGTPVSKGLSLAEGEALTTAFANWPNLVGFDLVEINPANDVAGQTVDLGAKVLLNSLFGLNAFRERAA